MFSDRGLRGFFLTGTKIFFQPGPGLDWDQNVFFHRDRNGTGTKKRWSRPSLTMPLVVKQAKNWPKQLKITVFRQYLTHTTPIPTCSSVNLIPNYRARKVLSFWVILTVEQLCYQWRNNRDMKENDLKIRVIRVVENRPKSTPVHF